MAKRNFEWYSVHINSVELHEMAQHNVEWYSVHTNGVASCEMARVMSNDVALHGMAVVISICCLHWQ